MLISSSLIWPPVDLSFISTGKNIQTERKNRFNKFFENITKGEKVRKGIVPVGKKKETYSKKSGYQLRDDSDILPHGEKE